MKSTFYTQDDVREMFREHIQKNYRFQSEAARTWNCSPAFVNAILQSLRDPSPIILMELGLEKVKGYVWVEKKHTIESAESPETETPKSSVKNPKILWPAADHTEYQIATVDLRKKLQNHIASVYKSSKIAAASWGCSVGLVSHVISGNKQFSSAMLRDLGFQRVTGYRKISNSNQGKQTCHQ